MGFERGLLFATKLSLSLSAPDIRLNSMKRGDPRIQKLVLRVMALVALPVLPSVFAPHLTVEKLSWLLGFGQPPKTPLLYYLAAGG